MKLTYVINQITIGFGGFAALLILPLTFALVYEVFSRYVLNQPTLWAFEVSYMVMGALFMLGMANTLRLKQHVYVDLVIMNLPIRLAAALRVLFYFLLIPLLCWLSYELALYCHDAFSRNARSGRSAWNPLVWPVYLSWFIGFALLSLQLISEFISELLVTLSGKDDSQ